MGARLHLSHPFSPDARNLSLKSLSLVWRLGLPSVHAAVFVPWCVAPGLPTPASTPPPILAPEIRCLHPHPKLRGLRRLHHRRLAVVPAAATLEKCEVADGAGAIAEFTVVMKFGGSSLASAARIWEVADLILSFPEEMPIAVLSAMGKATNNLLRAGEIGRRR